MAESRPNVPKVGSIKTAVETYWKKPALYNADIKELFPNIGNDKVIQLKRLQQQEPQSLAK